MLLFDSGKVHQEIMIERNLYTKGLLQCSLKQKQFVMYCIKYVAAVDGVLYILSFQLKLQGHFCIKYAQTMKGALELTSFEDKSN